MFRLDWFEGWGIQFAVNGLEEEFYGAFVDGLLMVCATDVNADGVGGEVGRALIDEALHFFVRLEEGAQVVACPLTEVAISRHKRAALSEPRFIVETIAVQIPNLWRIDDMAIAEALEQTRRMKVLKRRTGKEEAGGVAERKRSLSRPTPCPPYKGGSRMF